MRVELAASTGELGTAQLTRGEASHLGVSPGDRLHVRAEEGTAPSVPAGGNGRRAAAF